MVIHRNGRVQFNNGIKSFGLSKHLHGFVTFVCGPFSMFGRRGGLRGDMDEGEVGLSRGGGRRGLEGWRWGGSLAF